MSNNIQKYEHDRLSNITVLTIRQMDGYYGRDYAPEICAKFLQSAEQLPDKKPEEIWDTVREIITAIKANGEKSIIGKSGY